MPLALLSAAATAALLPAERVSLVRKPARTVPHESHSHDHTAPPRVLRSSSSLLQQPAPHAWEDEESCCGCDHDHDHVHVGVLHKHVEVSSHPVPCTMYPNPCNPCIPCNPCNPQVSNGAALMTLIYALLFSVHSLIAGLALGYADCNYADGSDADGSDADGNFLAVTLVTVTRIVLL